jgi:hypothetical protein
MSRIVTTEKGVYFPPSVALDCFFALPILFCVVLLNAKLVPMLQIDDLIFEKNRTQLMIIGCVCLAIEVIRLYRYFVYGRLGSAVIEKNGNTLTFPDSILPMLTINVLLSDLQEVVVQDRIWTWGVGRLGQVPPAERLDL